MIVVESYTFTFVLDAGVAPVKMDKIRYSGMEIIKLLVSCAAYSLCWLLEPSSETVMVSGPASGFAAAAVDGLALCVGLYSGEEAGEPFSPVSETLKSSPGMCSHCKTDRAMFRKEAKTTPVFHHNKISYTLSFFYKGHREI